MVGILFLLKHTNKHEPLSRIYPWIGFSQKQLLGSSIYGKPPYWESWIYNRYIKPQWFDDHSTLMMDKTNQLLTVAHMCMYVCMYYVCIYIYIFIIIPIDWPWLAIVGRYPCPRNRSPAGNGYNSFKGKTISSGFSDIAMENHDF